MKICPICAERYPDTDASCLAHRERPLLHLGVEAGDPLVGTLLDGRYLVLDRLGEGGMGTVYKAWQQRVNRVVAIKTIRGGLADADVRARFIREAEATARLKSPHTITVHDSGELPDGTLYIAMEFLAGRALSEILELQGPLPLPRLLRLALQLCDSLAEAHDIGLVHRDIKPSNLFVTDRAGAELLTVLDFGVVKLPDLAAHKLTREGMTVGSLSYMSPEQIDGRSVEATSDLYAVGVTLYQLASGELPFTGPTAITLMYKHLSETPPHLMGLLGATPAVAALDAVIQRCLRKRAAERFDSAAALRVALAAVPVESHPAAAGSTRLPLRPRPPLRPRDAEADPAQLPGVSVGDVHRRVAENRLAQRQPVSGVGAHRPSAGRTARLAAITVAGLLGLYVLLDGLFGG